MGFRDQKYAELEQAVLLAREVLREAQSKLEAAIVSDAPVNVGDVVRGRKGSKAGAELQISHITASNGYLEFHARKRTKTGWHANSSRLYLWGKFEDEFEIIPTPQKQEAT